MKSYFYDCILNIILIYTLPADRLNFIKAVPSNTNFDTFIKLCLKAILSNLRSHKGCRLCYGYLITVDVELETNLFVLSLLLPEAINHVSFKELYQTFHLLKISNPILHATNELISSKYHVSAKDEPSSINFKLFTLSDLKINLKDNTII